MVLYTNRYLRISSLYYGLALSCLMTFRPSFAQLVILNSQSETVRMTNDGRLGIGTTLPQASLDVAGNVRISDLANGHQQMLIADAVGNLSTQPQFIDTDNQTLSLNRDGQPGALLSIARGNTVRIPLPIPGSLVFVPFSATLRNVTTLSTSADEGATLDIETLIGHSLPSNATHIQIRAILYARLTSQSGSPVIRLYLSTDPANWNTVDNQTCYLDIGDDGLGNYTGEGSTLANTIVALNGDQQIHWHIKKDDADPSEWFLQLLMDGYYLQL